MKLLIIGLVIGLVIGVCGIVATALSYYRKADDRVTDIDTE